MVGARYACATTLEDRRRRHKIVTRDRHIGTLEICYISIILLGTSGCTESTFHVLYDKADIACSTDSRKTD
jgi:hypothetical protein